MYFSLTSLNLIKFHSTNNSHPKYQHNHAWQIPLSLGNNSLLDYRFQQIIHRMRLINFHFDQSLDLMAIISDLMHQDQEPELVWLHTYAQGLEAAYQAEFWDHQTLHAIAIETYTKLNS